MFIYVVLKKKSYPRKNIEIEHPPSSLPRGDHSPDYPSLYYFFLFLYFSRAVCVFSKFKKLEASKLVYYEALIEYG